ncbi:permease [Salmonella bongori]|nr:permease [Salmonella bongori]
MSNSRWWSGLSLPLSPGAIGGTGVALLNLLFGSGGSWLDPLLPIVVLAVIMVWVRWQAQGIKEKRVVKD